MHARRRNTVPCISVGSDVEVVRDLMSFRGLLSFVLFVSAILRALTLNVGNEWSPNTPELHTAGSGERLQLAFWLAKPKTVLERCSYRIKIMPRQNIVQRSQRHQNQSVRSVVGIGARIACLMVTTIVVVVTTVILFVCFCLPFIADSTVD